MDEEKRLSTGIQGLDEKMEGGFVNGSVNLVTGKTGTGKTSVCISYLYAGARAGEPGVYITTEQHVDDVKKDIKKMFGWDLDALEKKRLMSLVSIKPVLPTKTVTPDKLAQMIKLHVFNVSTKVQKAVMEIRAKRVVLDSVSMIEMFIKDEYSAKAALMQFVDTLKSLGVTSILTGTVAETSEELSGKGIIEYLVDCIIKLSFIPITEEFKRTLLIRKMRRTDHSHLVHPFEFTNNGLKLIDIKNI